MGCSGSNYTGPGRAGAARAGGGGVVAWVRMATGYQGGGGGVYGGKLVKTVGPKGFDPKKPEPGRARSSAATTSNDDSDDDDGRQSPDRRRARSSTQAKAENGNGGDNNGKKPLKSASLMDQVEILKEELGLEGSVKSVIEQAVKQLGVRATGKSLSEMADACIEALSRSNKVGPGRSRSSAASPRPSNDAGTKGDNSGRKSPDPKRPGKAGSPSKISENPASNRQAKARQRRQSNHSDQSQRSKISKPSKASMSSIVKDSVKVGGLNHAGFIIDNPGKLNDFYDVDKKVLGEGSFGTVSKCRSKATSAVRACKSIAKKEMKDPDKFRQEIEIMKIMDHPNIIKLFESFEDHRNIYLIMELATGGELFDRIIEAGHFTEVQAATVMKHVFRAIFYMHESHICHRDIKPENFIFNTKENIDKALLKVIDFGLACKFDIDQVLTTKAGTPYYVAPQVLEGKYDQASDLWSLGVVMYVLLCGYPPFSGNTDADLLAKVRKGKFDFPSSDWKSVSEDAKGLIRHLIKMNPRDRYTAEQALSHIWVKNKAPKAQNVPLQSSLVANLRGFRSRNKLKKAALHVIATQLGEAQIKALRNTFMALDKNGDGLLTASEMKEGMKQCGLKEIPKDLKQILEDVDSDGSGVINYTEFLAASLDKKVYMAEDVCWQAFRIFDRNGDGKINKDEVAMVLHDDGVESSITRDIAAVMADIDKNGDGQINFKEFMAMMRVE